MHGMLASCTLAHLVQALHIARVHARSNVCRMSGSINMSISTNSGVAVHMLNGVARQMRLVRMLAP
jgi:hypothetical protein